MLVFEAKRVPELGRSPGRSIKEFRKGVSEDNTGHNELRELRSR